jgi:hypothetical protein
MNCNKAKENIGALIDGELGLERATDLERHIEMCEECSEAKDLTLSLSTILRASSVPGPSSHLRARINESFELHHLDQPGFWQRLGFGSLLVQKPIFASLVILALAGFWLSYQIGKVNSDVVLMSAPTEEKSERVTDVATVENTGKTIYVEVPVIREKTVFRTVYLTRPSRFEQTTAKRTSVLSEGALPAFSSTSTTRGISNDLDLSGYQPPAEMKARIIKEINNDER